MKLLMTGLIMSLLILSCGGANDGDAATDTTHMPVDTNLNNSNVDHINRADGTILTDTTGQDTLRNRQ